MASLPWQRQPVTSWLEHSSCVCQDMDTVSAVQPLKLKLLRFSTEVFAVACIRTFLKKSGPSVGKIQMTIRELILNFVAKCKILVLIILFFSKFSSSNAKKKDLIQAFKIYI